MTVTTTFFVRGSIVPPDVTIVPEPSRWTVLTTTVRV